MGVADLSLTTNIQLQQITALGTIFCLQNMTAHIQSYQNYNKEKSRNLEV
jgi:hypothetical protein